MVYFLTSVNISQNNICNGQQVHNEAAMMYPLNPECLFRKRHTIANAGEDGGKKQVRMQINIVTVKNSMMVSQRTRRGAAIGSSNPTNGYIAKGNKISMQHWPFHRSDINDNRKQIESSCPLVDKWIKDLLFVCI